MNTQTHIFTGQEAAIAYALSAERICGEDASFLNSNPSCVPIFVSLLFQSLEISIKQAGIESGLFTIEEARSRKCRSGHGINELAALAVEKLGGNRSNLRPLVMAMTFEHKGQNSKSIIKEMICGAKLAKTRESFATRCLGYEQVATGDFQIIEPLRDWIEAVKETANNIPQAIKIIDGWKTSTSTSKRFMIWFKQTQKK